MDHLLDPVCDPCAFKADTFRIFDIDATLVPRDTRQIKTILALVDPQLVQGFLTVID